MPFAGYSDFDDCVSDNQDKDDPEAYCAAIKREVEGDGALSEDERDHYDRLVDDADRGEAALAQFRNPAEIRRVDESGDGVRYKRVMLLSPGTWTDAGSEQAIDYSAEGIRASAENFVDIDAVRERVPDWPDLPNDERAARLRDLDADVLADAVPINFLHGPSLYGAESLDEVGEIPADSIIVDDQGRLYGDLLLHGDSPQSETAIDLMDEVLEAAQDPGQQAPPVGPSVEIPADDVEITDRGVAELQEAWFSATGVVFNPASRPVELEAQARERAVAMQADGEDRTGVVYRAAGEADAGDTLLRRLRLRWRMSSEQGELPDFDAMDDEDLQATLQTMREDMDELERALQGEGEMAAVFDLTTQYAQDGNDLQDPVTEFVDWMEANTDMSGEDVQDVLDAYLQSVDADSLDATPVEGLQDWLDEQGAAGEEEGGDEEGEGEEEEMTMEDLETVKETVGTVAEHLGDIKDMLTEREAEREATLEELERRLSDIEDEPQRRALEEPNDGEFYDGDDGGSAEAADHEDVML